MASLACRPKWSWAWARGSLSLGRILGSGPPLQVLDQVLEEFSHSLADEVALEQPRQQQTRVGKRSCDAGDAMRDAVVVVRHWRRDCEGEGDGDGERAERRASSSKNQA